MPVTRMPVPDTVQIEIKLASSTTKKVTFNELLFRKLKEEAMTNSFKIEEAVENLVYITSN